MFHALREVDARCARRAALPALVTIKARLASRPSLLSWSVNIPPLVVLEQINFNSSGMQGKQLAGLLSRVKSHVFKFGHSEAMNALTGRRYCQKELGINGHA